MTDADDLELLRLRLLAAVDDLESLAADAHAGGLSFVARTVTVTTYPTAASRYYAIKRVELAGTESEGSTASTTLLTGVFYGLNLGSNVPPAGTNVVVTPVPAGRFVFTY